MTTITVTIHDPKGAYTVEAELEPVRALLPRWDWLPSWLHRAPGYYAWRTIMQPSLEHIPPYIGHTFTLPKE